MVMDACRDQQPEGATVPADGRRAAVPTKQGPPRRRRPRLPARELLDDEYALRPRPRSGFLNRFFEPAPPEDTRERAQSPSVPPRDGDDAISRRQRHRPPTSPTSASPASSCPDDSSSGGESSDRATSPGAPDRRPRRGRTPNPPAEIIFHPLRSDFHTEAREDRLRIVNTQSVRVFERSRPMSLGVRVRIPTGYCGLLTCQKPAECVCVAEPVGAGHMDLRAQLLNVSRDPLDIAPGDLVLYFHLLREAPPEPWQTVNLSAPSSTSHPPAVFELRLERPARLNAHQSRHLTFETAHLCFGGDSHALIVPCRQPALRQVALEPMPWPPGRVPAVRAVNVGKQAVELPAGLPMARVVFTTVPVKSTPAVRPSPIRGLRFPRAPLLFRQVAPPTTPARPSDESRQPDSPPPNNKKRAR